MLYWQYGLQPYENIPVFNKGDLGIEISLNGILPNNSIVTDNLLLAAADGQILNESLLLANEKNGNTIIEEHSQEFSKGEGVSQTFSTNEPLAIHIIEKHPYVNLECVDIIGEPYNDTVSLNNGPSETHNTFFM